VLRIASANAVQMRVGSYESSAEPLQKKVDAIQYREMAGSVTRERRWRDSSVVRRAFHKDRS
jgi:hypothetical protein